MINMDLLIPFVLMALVGIVGWVEVWLQSRKNTELTKRLKNAEEEAAVNRHRWYEAMDRTRKWRETAVTGRLLKPGPSKRLVQDELERRRDRNKCDSIW